MDTHFPNWWEQPNGLFHPTAPVSPEVSFQTTLVLPSNISVFEQPAEIQLIFPVGPAVESVEVKVHLGRLLLSGLQAGVRFSRAVTLPDNLDLGQRSVLFGSTQLKVVIPKHPEAVWYRTWRRFWHWLLSALQRTLARLGSK